MRHAVVIMGAMQSGDSKHAVHQPGSTIGVSRYDIPPYLDVVVLRHRKDRFSEVVVHELEMKDGIVVVYGACCICQKVEAAVDLVARASSGTIVECLVFGRSVIPT